MQFRNSTTPLLLGINALFLLIIVGLLIYIVADDLFEASDADVDLKTSDSTPVAQRDTTVAVLDQRIDKIKPADRDPRSISSNVRVEVDAATVDTRANLAINRFKKMLEKDERYYSEINELKSLEQGIDQSLRADIEYIKQYISMKTDSRVPAPSEPTLQQAKQVMVADASVTPDRFNKVSVTATSASQHARSLAGLLKEVVESVESEQHVEPAPDNKQKQYIASLAPAALERRNEMRTIQVRRGDTLWKISTRAYGNGFAYDRIFKANPHLSSPDEITTGEILRVPL